MGPPPEQETSLLQGVVEGRSSLPISMSISPPLIFGRVHRVNCEVHIVITGDVFNKGGSHSRRRWSTWGNEGYPVRPNVEPKKHKIQDV